MTFILGVDVGSATLGEADHLIHRLAGRINLGADAVACTHLVRTGHPHVAVSLALPARPDLAAVIARAGLAAAGAACGDDRAGPAHLAGGAAHAAVEHASRRSGRAVIFPGVRVMTGTRTIGELVSGSAVDRVTVLGADGDMAPEPATPIDTRDHLRPHWEDGLLTLTLTPAGRHRLAPFEVPNPTPCCAGHG